MIFKDVVAVFVSVWDHCQNLTPTHGNGVLQGLRQTLCLERLRYHIFAFSTIYSHGIFYCKRYIDDGCAFATLDINLCLSGAKLASRNTSTQYIWFVTLFGMISETIHQWHMKQVLAGANWKKLTFELSSIFYSINVSPGNGVNHKRVHLMS